MGGSLFQHTDVILCFRTRSMIHWGSRGRSESKIEMKRMNPRTREAADRRERQRFNISAPLVLFIGGREVPAYTRDLSNRGVYFYLTLNDSRLIEQDFEFIVELPPEITLSTCCRIRCRGRAIRRDDSTDYLTGVAAEILDYSILREFAPAI